MGISGSGKSSIGSTLSEKLNWPFLEGDTFHPQENINKMSSGRALTDDDRLPWLRSIANKIQELRSQNQDAIIACSALKRSYREILSAADRSLVYVFLSGEKEVIADRIVKRKGHFMPPELLDSQIATLEEPAPQEAIRIDVTAPIDRNIHKILKLIRE